MPAKDGEITNVNKTFPVNEWSVPYLKGILVYDPETKKWKRGEQSLTSEEMTAVIDAGLLEVLSQILTELKVHTFYLQQGLNVRDEPEAIRNELNTVL